MSNARQRVFPFFVFYRNCIPLAGHSLQKAVGSCPSCDAISAIVSLGKCSHGRSVFFVTPNKLAGASPR